MEGQTSPHEVGTRRVLQTVALAAVVGAIFSALLLSPLPDAAKFWTTGIGIAGGAVFVAASCLYRVRHTTGHRRRAFAFFMAAAVLGAISNLLQVLASPTVSERSFVPTTVFLLLAVIAGGLGLASYPVARRRLTDLARMVLDGVVIGGSVMFLISVAVFPRLLQSGGPANALNLAMPVVDIVIATFAVFLILRSRPADRPLLSLAAGGFVCYAVSDVAYALQVGGSGTFGFGSVTDVGWIIGYVLHAGCCLAGGPMMGLLADGSDPYVARSETPSVESSPVVGTTIMFTLFLTSTVLSLFFLRQGTLTTPSALLWLLVILGIMARQTLLLIDNEQLRRVLEQRVQDRSRLLRQMTQQADLMVNAVGDGIYGVDHEGLVTFVNPAAARTLGYAEDALIGRPAHATFHAPDPQGRAYPVENCYITEAISKGVAVNAEDDTYVRSDGLQIPVEVTATPLYEDGFSTGAVVVFRDVTQRREVDRMKNEFVSMVSHELRTPLTAIRGSLGLMSGGALGKLSAPAGRMVDIALESSERLTRLINDILDIERIGSGGMAMQLADHSAQTLIQSAADQVQVLAAENGMRVEVTPGHARVHADADRVTQTLLNVLGNAIKFSPPGGTVNVGAATSREFVEFWVSDSGRGIPEDKLDRIFDRFEQVDSSDARDKGGSGLGLAISKSIVHQLGGRIWAANNPDGGATFRFTLPASGPQTSNNHRPSFAPPNAPARPEAPPDVTHDQPRDLSAPRA